MICWVESCFVSCEERLKKHVYYGIKNNEKKNKDIKLHPGTASFAIVDIEIQYEAWKMENKHSELIETNNETDDCKRDKNFN